jgi:hypothetical membrane protein
VSRKTSARLDVPWWASAASVAAPLLLAGGWTIAAERQPGGFSSIRDTISSLAARGAHDRWIMTAALAGVGACYILTALGLSPARPTGRTVLAVGGVGTLLVAAFPQPVRGNSVAHTAAATVAFVALGAWPVVASRRRSDVALLTRGASIPATIVLFALVLWFVLEVHGSQRGLAERAAALAEALWPLAVVAANRWTGAPPSALSTPAVEAVSP